MTTTTTSTDSASAIFNAINRRDFDQLEPLTTADVELLLPPGQLFEGRSGVERFLRTLDEILPDLILVAHHTYSGEDFSVVEWESFAHTAADRESSGLGVTVMRFDGDRVSRIHLYLDTAEWARVLGDANP